MKMVPLSLVFYKNPPTVQSIPEQIIWKAEVWQPLSSSGKKLKKELMYCYLRPNAYHVISQLCDKLLFVISILANLSMCIFGSIAFNSFIVQHSYNLHYPTLTSNYIRFPLSQHYIVRVSNNKMCTAMNNNTVGEIATLKKTNYTSSIITIKSSGTNNTTTNIVIGFAMGKVIKPITQEHIALYFFLLNKTWDIVCAFFADIDLSKTVFDWPC